MNFFEKLDELMMQLARNALEAQAKQLRESRAPAAAKNSPEPPPTSTNPPRGRRRRVAKGKGDVIAGRVLEVREEVSPASPGEATASAAKKDERR